MLVKAKKTMNGIIMGKTYQSEGLCADKKYIIIINDNFELFPYLSENFHIESPLTRLESFRAMIESKTFLIDDKQ